MNARTQTVAETATVVPPLVDCQEILHGTHELLAVYRATASAALPQAKEKVSWPRQEGRA